MSFLIESGVALPPRRPFGGIRGPGRPSKYPFNKMSPGDSFFVEATKKRPPLRVQRVMGAIARSFVKRHHPDWKFATRIVDNGVRVWRTA